ncbi:MAG TPA: hypothetical protein PLL75_05920 [Candidatus Omnitrophota bacterium]|nr:hypothetical protein [Candidatus Omnitrophota bacterium]HPS37245.1 hypothetical protein [Candidatus Omnitrophota bacterium]
MSASNILAGVVFGAIGFGAFIYGKKQSDLKVLMNGIILMVYPYFVTNAVALWSIGGVLTLCLFVFHD